MDRRTFLGKAIAATGLAATGCSGKGTTSSEQPPPTGTSGTPTTGTPGTGTTTGTTPAVTGTPLPIPPVDPGTLVGGRREFALIAQRGAVEFYAGQPADTMGFNGPYLGPTLRMRRGEAVTVRVTNDLDEPTTTHFHGAHVPAEADGGPHQMIDPGDTWEARWDVLQVGATLWYHAHQMEQTGRQVMFGLAGLLIVDDDDVDALGLPDRHGVDDVPLVIQDRRFNADGSLDYALSMNDSMNGFEGDTVVVNGAIGPYFDAEAGPLRLRLLNGSNARVLVLATDDGTPLTLIGGDLSLLAAPVDLAEIRLSPAERVEVVLDLTGRQGETLALVDRDGGLQILEIRVTGAPTGTGAVPAALLALPRLDPADVARVRPFELSMGGMMGGGFEINGEMMDPGVINEVVPVDVVEEWAIRNVGMMTTHNFHKHGAHFEVLERNGGPPDPWETGYKDTVYLAPGDVVRVLVKHTDYTDPVLPYMYHCHVLEHEDAGMMGQFTVV